MNSPLSSFITKLAWIGLVIAVLRIVGLVFAKRHPLEYAAEVLGENPRGKALARAALALIVCACWIATTFGF